MLKFLVLLFFPCLVYANISIIRDTELEEYTLSNVKKLFSAGGLDENAARIVFLNDPTLNAFVAGGSTIFIHTGLLEKSDNPDEFFGVLAHETGHIVAGHTVGLQQKGAEMQKNIAITTILGGLAGIISGRPDLSMAIIMGGVGTHQNFFNTYRQSEENSADSLAVSISQKAGFNIDGLLNIMQKIKTEEQISLDPTTSVFNRTHPLTSQRINFLKSAGARIKPKESDLNFRLIKAKLDAFLNEPDDILKKYNNQDEGLYAQSIAYLKKGHISKAIEKLKILTQKYPQNPFFYELMGQIYLETGYIQKAIKQYEIAIELKPHSPLILIPYGQALIENKEYQKASVILGQALFLDDNLLEGWRLLEKSYTLSSNKEMALYASIELLWRQKKYSEALHKIILYEKSGYRAKKIRIEDIKIDIKNNS